MHCATFDIESSALEAVGAGFMICAVIKPLFSDKLITLRYDKLNCKPGKEKALVEDTIDNLSKFDLLIGHNIKSFDINYIKSRAIQLGVPYNLSPLVYDTKDAFKRTGLRTVDNGFGKPSASLAMVIDFFDIDVQKKYPLYPRQHWKTVWQEGKERSKAMTHLVEHCQTDVIANEKVYWKLLEIDKVWGLRRVK